MKNKTITVPIEWFEGLFAKLQVMKMTQDAKTYTETLNALLGYIQSAEHIIKQNNDETNKV